MRYVIPMNANTLLLGVVGSTAYGLAGPDSDIDRLGVYAEPTVNFHGLDKPGDCVRSDKPDVMLHEMGKFCHLALDCNPHSLELLFLEDYEIATPLGQRLIELRSAFLSADGVRKKYVGYAVHQLARMGTPASTTTPARAAKNARHLLRLVHQGYGLYTTGTLRVRLNDPDRYRRFGESAITHPGVAQTVLMRSIERFAAASSPLPEHPDRDAVDQWLKHARSLF